MKVLREARSTQRRGHWGADKRPGGDKGSRASRKRNLRVKVAKFRVRDEIRMLG